MDMIKFSYEGCLFPERTILKTAELLKPEIQNMASATTKNYDDDRASINLPYDKDMLKEVKETIKEKSRLDPEYLVVIGTGGSNLGTIAVQEAVLGRLYNQLNPKIGVLYADTADTDYISNVIQIIELILKKGGNVIVNGISKSGTTTETIANFEVILNLLRRHKTRYRDYVVVTSDKESKLWSLAVEKGFDILEIPEKVGGRYSVLSSVGLFPLGLLGVDIEQLLAGAKDARDLCLQQNIEDNPAAISSVVQFLHYKKGKNIFDLFLFSNDLESLGKWHRQLMAESLGKKFNLLGERVNVGITPTVSVGSTDLHSVAQLYLGGPYDKFTTFVSVEKDKSVLNVPQLEGYSELVAGIQGKSLKNIMNAILEGTKMAFRKDKRPFVEILLPNKSSYSIGQFLQFKMIETMYMGYLLNVNPFNQPSVESYKKETRRILSQE
jgi:glucose-6-phosphate isomerase